MKRSTWILLGVVAVLAIYCISLFNRVKRADNGIGEQWGQVETAYQARADKTKNLVATIKGSAEFEQTTLREIVEARASATQMKVDPTNLTPESIKAYEEAQSRYGNALSRLLVVQEQYPTLQTTQAFRDFMTQYEGMENRISTERRKFNQAVGAYNGLIITFPGNIFASLFGFQKKEFYQAQEGTENAPDVDFTTK